MRSAYRHSALIRRRCIKLLFLLHHLSPRQIVTVVTTPSSEYLSKICVLSFHHIKRYVPSLPVQRASYMAFSLFSGVFLSSLLHASCLHFSCSCSCISFVSSIHNVTAAAQHLSRPSPFTPLPPLHSPLVHPLIHPLIHPRHACALLLTHLILLQILRLFLKIFVLPLHTVRRYSGISCRDYWRLFFQNYNLHRVFRDFLLGSGKLPVNSGPSTRHGA